MVVHFRAGLEKALFFSRMLGAFLGSLFSEFGLLCGTLLAPFAAMAPFWHAFGGVMGLFWLAFSTYARLELQGEPSQYHFDALVLFLLPLLRIFKVAFAEPAHDS